MDPIAMKALETGWQLGIGTRLPARPPEPSEPAERPPARPIPRPRRVRRSFVLGFAFGELRLSFR